VFDGGPESQPTFNQPSLTYRTPIRIPKQKQYPLKVCISLAEFLIVNILYLELKTVNNYQFFINRPHASQPTLNQLSFSYWAPIRAQKHGKPSQNQHYPSSFFDS
jgi:hypothetical protein